MKHKKSTPLKKKSSSNNFFTPIIVVLIIALFFVFSWKNISQKDTEEWKQTFVCSSDNFPVCWKDGKTYTNSCTAEKIANVHVAYVGECREDITEIKKPTTSIEPENVVDSGIQNLESVPKFMTDRTDTYSIETPAQNTDTTSLVETSTISTPISQADPTWFAYFNNNYHYGFSMPKNSYYQAFGAQNGATHTVGITIGKAIDSLSGNDVRIYFYANKIINEISGRENGQFTDPVSHTIYLLLNNKNSVAIESDNEQSELVQTIIKTIHAE